MSVDDVFELYDLRVEVVAGERDMVCNHEAGDYFELSGENRTGGGAPVKIKGLDDEEEEHEHSWGR